MSTFYALTNKQRIEDVELFCLQFSIDVHRITEEILSFEAIGEQRVQLYLNFESFLSDLGDDLIILEGFNHTQLMSDALRIAVQHRQGSIVDLTDILLVAKEMKIDEFLTALRNYLGKIPADLIKTADMYILTQANAVLAAQELYLHRNTFNYRLNKFTLLTQIDLRNPTLYQFYKIMRTLVD